MSKHIIGQAIYQISVIMVMLFLGHKFLSDNADYSVLVLKGWEVDEESDEYPSMHFTYLFNTFVCLQIFNFVNARKLKDEFNIFGGISKSIIFFVIVLIIILFQIGAISLLGRFFGVHQWGLPAVGWAICIGFGFGGWIVNIFLKLIPENKLCPCLAQKGFGKKEENPLKKEHKRSLSESLRQKHDAQYYRKRSSLLSNMAGEV